MAFARAGSPSPRPAESPSYKAYVQGQYMTALKLAETEAAQGSKEAYTLLGEIYAEGLGVAQDYTRPPTPTARAPISAMPTPSSRLAHSSLEGRGIKKDLKRAADLFEKAARTATPRRNTTLPSSISTARAAPPTRRRRPSGCRRRLSRQPAAAEYDLGGFYQFGRGVPIDKAKAAEWTGKAAEAGLPEAEVEYGVMLFKGEGVAVDEQRAAKMFRLSAEQGNPVAQNRLARLYANGVVVGPADPVQAAKWHLLAREAGVSDFTLDLMLAKLTPEQRAAADKAAASWRRRTPRRMSPALDSGRPHVLKGAPRQIHSNSKAS